MRTLAIVNQKGGTGKTTTAVSLAAALGERKRKVLLIDLDPQASATVWLGIRDPGPRPLDLFIGKATLANLVQPTGVDNVSIVPSSTWLVRAETETILNRQTILKRALDEAPRDWDYILLDCPPSLGVLTVNALVAAGELLVPVEAHLMAVDGVVRLLDTVRKVRDQLNPGLALAGILACRVDARTRHAPEVVDLLREKFSSDVYRTTIHENVRLAEAYAFAKAITIYAPRSTGAEDHRRLAAEIIKQEKKQNESEAKDHPGESTRPH